MLQGRKRKRNLPVKVNVSLKYVICKFKEEEVVLAVNTAAVAPTSGCEERPEEQLPLSLIREHYQP